MFSGFSASLGPIFNTLVFKCAKIYNLSINLGVYLNDNILYLFFILFSANISLTFFYNKIYNFIYWHIGLSVLSLPLKPV